MFSDQFVFLHKTQILGIYVLRIYVLRFQNHSIYINYNFIYNVISVTNLQFTSITYPYLRLSSCWQKLLFLGSLVSVGKLLSGQGVNPPILEFCGWMTTDDRPYDIRIKYSPRVRL